MLHEFLNLSQLQCIKSLKLVTFLQFIVVCEPCEFLSRSNGFIYVEIDLCEKTVVTITSHIFS